MYSQLFDLWAQISEDLNYNEAILDGSWPSAVEQLERALIKAKEIAAERKAEEDKEFRGNF